MRTLIVQLPAGLPHPALAYPHALAGAESMAQALKLQWSVSSLLPRPAPPAETVAMVPAQALSWHRVELPATIPYFRLRPIHEARLRMSAESQKKKNKNK